ncbi:hypothetical protein B0H14DRAFT_2633049 [Mycena olivaceomarginata]|nr:hypothetical protein B0H14DRAFT_2633049 [Mycena olivaceomarginata]
MPATLYNCFSVMVRVLVVLLCTPEIAGYTCPEIMFKWLFWLYELLKGLPLGLNGLTSVLACLAWWYRVAGISEGGPRWRKMVEDVTWVLTGSSGRPGKARVQACPHRIGLLEGLLLGLNGLTSVLACLAWWYRVAGISEGGPRWRKMVEDVTWVLSEKQRALAHKQAAPDGLEKPASKRVRTE